MPRRKHTRIDASIGKRLRFYRMQAGLTQKQIADVLGIDRTTYTKYETGVSDPSTEIMGRIVKALGVDYNTVLLPKKGETRIGSDETGSLNADESGFPEFLNMSSLDCDERDVIASYRVLPNEKKAELQNIIREMLNNRNSGQAE